MKFEEVVQKQMNKLISEGFLEKVAREQLEKTVKDIIQELLRGYSDFGIALKKDIKSKLKVDLTRLDITEYNIMLMDIIQKEFHKSLESAVKPIREIVMDITGELEKKEWTLEEIVDEFIECVMGDVGCSCDYEGEITVHAEEDVQHKWVTVHLDEESDKAQHLCKYRFLFSTDEGRGIFMYSKENVKQLDPDYGFDRFLFRIYASRAAVTMSEYETHWYRGDN